MKVTLTNNQLALKNALAAAELHTEGIAGATFQLDDWLRILADQYGVSELTIGLHELVTKLTEEHRAR